MRTSLPALQDKVRAGGRLAAITCYDAGFARALEDAGADLLLVGDSLGMVVQGEETTLPVTLEAVAYHTRCVARGASRAFLFADLPFGSYQASPADALRAAATLLAAGAQMVKLEGGAVMAETVAFLTARGIPVCAHIGLMPQAVHLLGGFRMQGKEEAAADALRADAKALAEAGAGLIVLESIPAALAQRITGELSIPTIGIGAGPHCRGQVLVLHDLLGVTPNLPRFAKNFLAGTGGVREAAAAYVQAVHAGEWPA